MDYSYYYDAARKRARHARQPADRAEQRWLRELPYEVREGDLCFCHGSPLNLEELETSSRPSRRPAVWRLGQAGHGTFIGHSHLCRRSR